MGGIWGRGGGWGVYDRAAAEGGWGVYDRAAAEVGWGVYDRAAAEGVCGVYGGAAAEGGWGVYGGEAGGGGYMTAPLQRGGGGYMTAPLQRGVGGYMTVEVTLHQHTPMFIFCRFLSDGHVFKDCGRPCERHKVEPLSRTGARHPLVADLGCHDTLSNGTAQTGTQFLGMLRGAGCKHFRLEHMRLVSSRGH